MDENIRYNDLLTRDELKMDLELKLLKKLKDLKAKNGSIGNGWKTS